VLRDGAVVRSVDEATGGHHMTLVLSGGLRLDYEEAESLKRDPAEEGLVIGLIRPTLEKMATIAARATADQADLPVYLVGGSSSFAQAPSIFQAVLERPVSRPDEPLFPTPLGTAMRRNRD
jgi:ethanolamine utilization protein EutJ